MERIENFLDKYWWLTIIILSIPAFWALLVPGFYGASDDLHIGWLHQMDKVLRLGQIPPRFVPDLSFGFGYPLFNFVFPLPFYIADIFHRIGFSLVDSIKTLFLLSLPISGIFMYLLLRGFISPILSMAGAVIYIYTPYRSTDIYVRGAIGEIVSFIFLPLIVLSFIKLTEDHEKFNFWIGIGALSLASLVLSHNITAFMFLPYLFLLIILRVFFTSVNPTVSIKRIFISIILAVSISLYFWLPAMVESNLMKYDTVFAVADHFPTILQLVTPYWGYGASVAGPYDGMSFFMGVINIALIIGTILILIAFRKKIEKDLMVMTIWAMIVIFSSIFMMNYRSLFLWENLPLLPYFQFPWRFLVMVTLATPISVIVLSKFKYQNYLALSIIVLSVGLNATSFRPQDFLGREDDYYLNRYIPTPLASQEYLEIQEEYLRLPKNTYARPDRNYPLVSSESEEIENITFIDDLKTEINTQSNDKFILTYNKYYFPGWQARVDGILTEITPGTPFGEINILVDEGEHQIEIFYQESGFRLILNWISFISFIVTLFLIFKNRLPIRLFQIHNLTKIRG
ncbi:MAG: hypothetical protein Q8P92_01715 [Candidatus Daviesbacteria bacterium]|nr:hypothetical protein [Candidatus Daviesbacteria bacterium]